MKIFLKIIFYYSVLFTAACSDKMPEKINGHPVVTATKSVNTHHLYFSGTIQPLQLYNALSAVDGVVKKLYFRYGDQVKPKQLLVSISSKKSKEEYATMLTNYIKDKDQYLRSKNSFEATSALYKAGIVDKETFLSEKSQLSTNHLAYINSQNRLEEMAKNFPDAAKNLKALKLEDVEAIQSLLDQQGEDFFVYAPFGGVVLFPEKTNADAAADAEKILTPGSEVKKDQVLVSLGETSGIATTIHVGETDVNQIARGQSAVLTSPALPGMIFYGQVSDVAKQAKSNPGGGGGDITFPVQVVVPKITDMQKRMVRVGMSVKVDITVQSAEQIKIPIKAVYEQDDMPTVDVVDPKTRKLHPVAVETGDTDVSHVVITRGLKPGDRVVVHD